jgi:hypothetical protein
LFIEPSRPPSGFNGMNETFPVLVISKGGHLAKGNLNTTVLWNGVNDTIIKYEQSRNHQCGKSGELSKAYKLVERIV